MSTAPGASSARILVLGAAGQVGWELCRTLSPLGHVVACSRAQLDLTDLQRLRAVVREVAPALIVNAAAHTAVDRAETETALAQTLNADVPRVLAEESARIGAALIHYSTDYVFDGNSSRPYSEDDSPLPVNQYGATKLAGEQAALAVGGAVLVLRTSWIYGLRGRNFLLTVRRLATQEQPLRIVADQFGSPTWCRSVAEATAQIVARGGPDPAAFLARHRGVYHLSAQGITSWHGFASAIVERLARNPELQGSPGRPPRVDPIATREYPTPARRPAYSVLDSARARDAFGVALPPWEKALDLALDC